MSDQLTRVRRPPQTLSQLRSGLVGYLKSNPTTLDGVQFREFINHGGWDTYLQRMSRDGAWGEWGEWIALWGLVNTFSLLVALVSSLRERGLQIINPATNGDEGGDLTVMVLLRHEAEVHYHSLEAPKDPVTIWRRKSHRGDLPKGLGKSYAIHKESLKG